MSDVSPLTIEVCSACGAQAGVGAHGHSDTPDWHWERVEYVPKAERDRYREALQEIADIEGDQGPGRIAADALRASGIDPFSEAGKR